MAKETFGRMPDGRAIDRYTLANEHLTVKILTLGAILNDVRMKGIDHPLTLGSESSDAYLAEMAFFGAIVGPVANRIAGGRTSFDGTEISLERNEDDKTTLHGGYSGTYAQLWTAEDFSDRHLCLSLQLADGAGGFPGKRTITAEYSIDGPALALRLKADSDAPTLMNLAHHGYWNLDGADTVAGHRLSLAADHWLPVDLNLIPTGEIASVENSAFDFREGRQLRPGEDPEYDHNFCLSDAKSVRRTVLRLTGTSGISMEISTTEPGLQLYDGKRTATVHAGLGGKPYGAFSGVALEPQGWPDAPNRPEFPSVGLQPEESYLQETIFTFSR